MLDLYKIMLPSLFLVLIFLITCCLPQRENPSPVLRPVQNPADVPRLFPQTAPEITQRATWAMKHAEKELKKLLAIPAGKQTFENIVRAFDTISAHFSSDMHIISGLIYVHPDKEMRDEAQKEIVTLQEFAVDHFSNNIDLYHALKTYARTNAHKEPLTEEQKFYLHELLADFKRAGLELPEDKRNQVAQLKKRLNTLALEFETNIATDTSSVHISKPELAGIDEEFINQLEKDENSNFILKMDYPTIAQIMKHCTVEETRKKMLNAFNNRAYPINMPILDEVIEKRDQLAHLLGYESYAHIDIDDSMAQTPEHVQEFLDKLVLTARKKQDQEFKQLIHDLPETISLNEKGQLNPWDVAFTKEQYKQKYLNLDDRKIAEYFPMEKTVEGLLAIYQQFLGLTFKQIPITGLWHKDVQMIEVRDSADNTLYGYLLLDLYPRANKFSHAAHMDFTAITVDESGTINTPNVALIMANFPQSTPSKPSLLKHSDVTTFFHEFGHAMHAVLGATHLAGFSGTSVKTDFVELPSQMFEEWMYDPEILKKISSHYQTGKPLPDSMIQTIKDIQKFDAGDFITTQSMYSQMSLDYFKKGEKKNTTEIMHELYQRFNPHIALDPAQHKQASFGHLMGYGAKYYGYMWSRVFAADLFDYIKQHGGLLDPQIGMQLRKKVLSKGGSIKPDVLIRNFLGREPHQEAFKKNLGLT